jgi:hypothetical protein
MATQIKATKKTSIDKKDMLKTVTEQLNTNLTSLKIQLGEKEFKKRIKKAAKKLVAGIKKTPLKKISANAKKATVVKKKAEKNLSKK